MSLLLASQGPLVYTMVCDSGVYNLTGSTANLLQHRKLIATAGVYNLAGTNASLNNHKRIIATAGIYSIAGSNANLMHQLGGGCYRPIFRPRRR